MSERDPYAEGLETVWRDPMGYDVTEHGPPYLPVTATQRDEGREFATRSAAYYDVGQRMVPEGSPYDILAYMLAALRTLSMVHQTAHWQVKGGHFYGDHQLFARLYEESQPSIDSLAERLIGLTGDPKQVDIGVQVNIMQRVIRVVRGTRDTTHETGEQLAECSLTTETILLGGIAYAKKVIDEAGALTEGLDDLLQGIASKHEEFVYLLKQRTAGSCYGGKHHGKTASTGYDYDRRE